MQAADVNFTRGLRYIEAAQRCRAWGGDDETQGRLCRLAESYSQRGQALMMNGLPGVDDLQRSYERSEGPPTGTL